MVYLFNVCDGCGLQYQLGSLEDAFCPDCGTRIAFSTQVQNIIGCSDNEEVAKLRKQLSEKDLELRSLSVSMSELQKKTKKELNSMEELCREKNYQVLSCENQIKQSQAEITFLKKKLESKSGIISADAPDTKTEEGIYLEYLGRKNRKGNPLPDKFIIKYLDLRADVIADCEVGTGAAVYICQSKYELYNCYPSEMILAPDMRLKYKRLFNLSNEDGSKVMDIVPCHLSASNTGYYKLISKGKIIFY